VWALDFQFDQAADGRILKMLHIVDEFTRDALDVGCERRIDADQAVARLERIVAETGRVPAFIRADNGPELTPTRSGTGAASRVPAAPTSSPARRGRTPTSSPSAHASATSCYRSNTSAA
jgi:putative transposase